MNRRGFVTSLVSFIAAPAIVRASSLMPIKSLDRWWFTADEIMAGAITSDKLSAVGYPAAIYHNGGLIARVSKLEIFLGERSLGCLEQFELVGGHLLHG